MHGRKNSDKAMGNLRPFIATDSEAKNWSAEAKLLENDLANLVPEP